MTSQPPGGMTAMTPWSLSALGTGYLLPGMAAVQPQEVETLLIFSVPLPRLATWNLWTISGPSSTLPKSNLVLELMILGAWAISGVAVGAGPEGGVATGTPWARAIAGPIKNTKSLRETFILKPPYSKCR